MPGHLAQRSIALHADKLLQGIHDALHVCSHGSLHLLRHRLRIDLEECLVGVLQLPYEHQSNHDGVAHLVVHLDGLGIKVAGSHREGLGSVERVDPVVTGLRERARVLAEPRDDTCLVGLQHDEPAPKDDGQDASQHTQHQVITGHRVNRDA